MACSKWVCRVRGLIICIPTERLNSQECLSNGQATEVTEATGTTENA